jgi:small subunit ribosomal protein S21
MAYISHPLMRRSDDVDSRPSQEGSVISNVIQVRIKRGETVDRALKRLKKVLDKEGLMREIRNNRYFEKPSEQKRREKARARIRAKMQGR